MPNIKDVAARAGVSVATVSRALHNDPKVSAKRRDQVLKAAKDLGYQANPLAERVMSSFRRKYASGSLGTFALLTEKLPVSAPPHHPLRLFEKGAMDAASANGFVADRVTYSELSPSRLGQVLHHRGIDAAVVSPIFSFDRRPFQIELAGLTAILTGWGWSDPPYHRVATDHTRNMLLALQKAAACGPRIAAFLQPDIELRTSHTASAVFLMNHPMGFRSAVDLMFINEPGRVELLKKQLMKSKGLDCLIVSHNALLNSLGDSLPPSLPCISLDGPLGRNALGHIDLKYELMGFWAAELLLGSLFLGDRGLPRHQKVLLVEPGWVDGGTMLR